MAKKEKRIDTLTEEQVDKISRRAAENLHKYIPEELKGEIKEIEIARCAKSVFTATHNFVQMVEDAMDQAAENLCNEGSVNVRFTKWQMKFLGMQCFGYLGFSVKEYAESIRSENPLSAEHPLTLTVAVAQDIFESLVSFFEMHHVEEDIVDGKGGLRLVEAEPAEAPNGEKVN